MAEVAITLDRRERNELREHVRNELEWIGIPNGIADPETGRKVVALVGLMDQLGWGEDDRELFPVEGDFDTLKDIVVSYRSYVGDCLLGDVQDEVKFGKPDFDPEDYLMPGQTVSDLISNTRERITASRHSVELMEGIFMRVMDQRPKAVA